MAKQSMHSMAQHGRADWLCEGPRRGLWAVVASKDGAGDQGCAHTPSIAPDSPSLVSCALSLLYATMSDLLVPSACNHEPFWASGVEANARGVSFRGHACWKLHGFSMSR